MYARISDTIIQYVKHIKLLKIFWDLSYSKDKLTCRMTISDTHIAGRPHQFNLDINFKLNMAS